MGVAGQQSECPDKPVLGLGIAVLLIGVIYYLLFRTDTPVFLSIVGIDALTVIPAALMNGATWLPTFVHVVAFTLFTAAWLPRHPRIWALVAGSWAAINIAFEAIQLPSLRPDLESNPVVMAALSQFASSGTFDPLDVAAAVAGALVGFGFCSVANSWARGDA